MLDRWKQYFADLMKTDRKIENQVPEEHTSENEIEIKPRIYKEVSDMIKKTKREQSSRHRQYSSRTDQVWKMYIKTECIN